MPEDSTVPSADLPILDFSKWDVAGEKERLAEQVKDAATTTGLFHVRNFGIPREHVNRQWELGRDIFLRPEAELNHYVADLSQGDYSGYRPLGLIEQYPGLRDNFESYNIYKLNSEAERSRPHLQIVRNHYQEIEDFQRNVHQLVASRVLLLLSLVLEVSPEVLLRKHEWGQECSSFLRYLKYHPRSAELNARYNQVYTRGHTDFGSITFLFSNPVGGLQMQTPDGAWYAVRHIEDSVLVNIADIVSIWSRGYIRSCMHRVVSPPREQQHLERFSLIYFLRPSNAVRLGLLDSGVLQRNGLTEQSQSEELKAQLQMTVGQWVKSHTSKKARTKESKVQSEDTFRSFFHKGGEDAAKVGAA